VETDGGVNIIYIQYIMWHPKALKHGRVIESNCNFILNGNTLTNQCKVIVKKNSVLDKNGSNESSKLKWGKGISNNLKSAGRAINKTCKS